MAKGKAKGNGSKAKSKGKAKAKSKAKGKTKEKGKDDKGEEKEKPQEEIDYSQSPGRGTITYEPTPEEKQRRMSRYSAAKRPASDKHYQRRREVYAANKAKSEALAEKTGGGGRLRPKDFTIEDYVTVDVDPDAVDKTIREYANVVKFVSKAREKMKDEVEGERTFGKKIKHAIKNIPTMVRDAYDMTVGYVIASAQNHETLEKLKKDPKGTVLSFIIRGRAQTIGNGWRLGKTEKGEKRSPYHIKTKFKEGVKKAAEYFLDQVREVYKKAGIKDPTSRADVALCHSSGADTARYATTMPQFVDTGIKAVQGTGGAPYGFDPEESGLGAKLIGTVVDMKEEDPRVSKTARKAAIRIYSDGRPKHASYEAIAGSHDDLARAELSVDLGAEKIHIAPITHFEGAGAHPRACQMQSELMTKQRKRAIKKWKYQKAA